MKRKMLFATIIMGALTTLSVTAATAGFPAPPGVNVQVNGFIPRPPTVNVQIGGYLPAPPGVHVYVDSGRPYYVEHDRRVYMKKKHHKQKHKGRGHRNDKHDKHDDRGRGNGHGR